MNTQTTGAKLELMKHVERTVRPVVASWKQKMQMRADLLARLTALYEQEFARLGDAQAAVLQATQRVGSAVELSSQLQRSVSRRTYWECKIVQTLFGRPEDPPFSRAARTAAAVVLILLLACAVRPLCVLAGLVPEDIDTSCRVCRRASLPCGLPQKFGPSKGHPRSRPAAALAVEYEHVGWRLSTGGPHQRQVGLFRHNRLDGVRPVWARFVRSGRKRCGHHFQ